MRFLDRFFRKAKRDTLASPREIMNERHKQIREAQRQGYFMPGSGKDITEMIEQERAGLEVTIIFDRARALERQGEIDKAIELYKKAEESFPGMSHSSDRLAIIYRKRKEYDKEVILLEKEIRAFGPGVSPAIVKRLRGRLEKARALRNGIKSKSGLLRTPAPPRAMESVF